MVHDLIDLFSREGHTSITALNEEMEVLGWGIGVFDDELYGLAMRLKGGNIRTKRFSIVKQNAGVAIQDTLPSLANRAVA
jgi:hypothetical protein